MPARDEELMRKLGAANAEFTRDWIERADGRRVTIGPGGPRKRSFREQPDIQTNHGKFQQDTLREIAKVRGLNPDA